MEQTALEELIGQLESTPEKDRKAIIDEAMKATGHLPWIPNPGPQTEAYFSEADILLYGGEPGGGKGLKLDTPLPTPYGWTTMGEIQPGQELFDPDGNVCKVTAISKISHRRCFEISFSDGEKIIADDVHRWVTRSHRERMRRLTQSPKFREHRKSNRLIRGTGKRPDLTKRNKKSAKIHDLPHESMRDTLELFNTLRVKEGRLNHSIDITKPLNLPEQDLLIEPYILGAWIGDGHTNGGAITNIDEEILQQVANYYPLSQHKCEITYGVLGLQTKLRQLGVLGNKHIPIAYLRSSIDQRLELLQGMMDTDGYADKRGQCEYTTTNKAISEGIKELLNSLGIKASIKEGVAKLNGKDCGLKYRIKFLTELPVFKLSRKLIRQKRSGFRGTHNLRYITDIKEIESIPTKCISVDSESRQFLAGHGMIPTHNTGLVLGLAFTQHQRSLIMRRQYTDLGHILEEAQKLNGGKEGYNGSPPPKLKRDDFLIDFGAASHIGDEQHWQGNPHDFIGIDEATQFAELQIRFLMGWLRSIDKNQRKRVVLATNPPLTAEGLWVTEMFAPWLDPNFPNPAKPGELRYAILGDGDKEVWVDGPEDVYSEAKGKMVTPKSYTYIPASLQDNPFLTKTGYEKELDALPGEIHDVLMSGFQKTFRDQPNQIIPTEWVRLAQQRWRDNKPEGVPMCAMGVDCTGGGRDPLVLAPRYGHWFPKLIEVPGKDIPIDKINKTTAGHVVTNRKDQCVVVIDMGGGYGSGAYEILKDNEIDVFAYKGQETSAKKSKDGKLKFTNVRTAALWNVRELLDPDQPGGSDMALPPDNEIIADLTAPTYTITSGGIKAESKEDVCKRLQRSTNKGDAIIMACHKGPTPQTHGGDWAFAAEMRKRNTKPKVVMGRQRRR